MQRELSSAPWSTLTRKQRQEWGEAADRNGVGNGESTHDLATQQWRRQEKHTYAGGKPMYCEPRAYLKVK
jgi:hypothetical protein